MVELKHSSITVLASAPSGVVSFKPRGKNSHTQMIGGWVGPIVCLSFMAETRIHFMLVTEPQMCNRSH